MTSPLWSGSATYAWRNDGLLASRSWPSAGSGGAASFSYDAAKRATALAKAGTAAASFSQAYDRDGNVTSEGRSLAGISGDAGGNTQAFTYDGLNRLTASSGLAATVNASYAYDRDGNRTSSVVNSATTTFAYDRTAQLISRSDPDGSTSFAYDAYGNLTSSARAFDSVTAATYDLADRLTGLTTPDTTAYSFTLDALGRPLSRSDGSSSVDYAYVGTGITAWRTVSGSNTLDAALGPDQSRLALADGSAFAWLLPDLHGNVAAGIDSAETAVSDAWRYDGYGRSAASTSSSGLANPWTYQGRLDLAPAGEDPFYAAGARYYDPNLGTFTQLDSMTGSAQDPLSLNRYLYAEGNPATLIDPSGHRAVSVAQLSRSSTWDVQGVLKAAREQSHDNGSQSLLGRLFSVSIDAAREGLGLTGEALERGANNAIKRSSQWAEAVKRVPLVGGYLARETIGLGESVANLNRGIATGVRGLKRALGPIGAVLSIADGAETQLEKDRGRSDLSNTDRVRRAAERATTTATFAGVGSAIGGLCPGPWRLACAPIFGWVGEQLGNGPIGDAAIAADDYFRYDPGLLRKWYIDYETPTTYGNA
jgi:RHS repeat-associated protein